jgi:ABC-type antimicrobial peptide transport system permease subunit
MVMDSPYAPAEPTVFYLKGFNGGTNWINIRLKPDVTTEEALSRIEVVFRKVIPNGPFEYKFADQEYAIKFAEEERLGKLTAIFAGLAVFISCLGLSGLASFVAEQRTKEIGIRKILGATIENLWRLLSRDFVFLVLTGCAIAVPVAGYLTNEWLQKYSYRIEVSSWTFVIPALVALLLTLATVSFQAIKVAATNPVKSLKSE